jgi:predicted phage baseplate assembly protein
MMDCTSCFQDTAPPVPLAINNRPGLSAVAYRIGTFTSFRAALLDALAGTPELAGLGTRLSDDYSITVLELWAAVADVLTFYQERIANEAYLRTATLRDSVLRLVRLIDYQLRPGLAPTAALAFTLEPGAAATIPTGLRVQSVPAGNASPQKYETVESIAADARFNSLAILPAPQPISPLIKDRAAELFAPGADLTAFAASLAPGDRLVAYTPSSIEFLTVAALAVQADRLSVQWAIPPAADFHTAATGTATATGLFKLGRTFRLFGYDAPTQYIFTKQLGSDPTCIRAQLKTTPPLGIDPAGFFLDARYDGIKPGAALLIVTTVDGSGTPTTTFATVLKVAEAPATSRGGIEGVATWISVTCPNGPPPSTGFTAATIYELLGPQLRLLAAAFPSRLSVPELYVSGHRNGWDSIEVGRVIVKGVIQPGVTLGVNDLATGREVILVDADPTTAVAATVAGAELVGDQLSFGVAGTDLKTVALLGLDPTTARQITALASPPLPAKVSLHNARLELLVSIGQHPAQSVSLAPPLAAPGNIDVSTVAAALQAAIRAALPEAPEFANALVFNAADLAAGGPACLVVVPGVPEMLIAVAPTASDPDTVVDLGLDAAHMRYLDGVASGPLNLTAAPSASLRVSLGLLPAQVVTFAIAASSVATAQVLAAALKEQLNLADLPIIFVTPAGRMLSFPPAARFERPAFLHITVTPAAAFDLDPSSAVLLANVARASQGETVANEVVGDGDASVAFPTFALLKKPVTFLPGDGPHGAQSPLKVAVGGVQWQEVASLYGAGPNDTVYVTRLADDGTLTMEFGDGNTGARQTTGRANLVATYRQGASLAGRVGANTLTSLLDSINGVKRVTNPLAADGGADPQTLADARTNAPTTVRTFGRAVSLEDFEDVALASGEIAKASATWVWTGLQKMIFLTVAAQKGARLSPDGLRQLWTALQPHRDPDHPLRIDNFVRVPILVAAALTTDPRYDAAAVRAAAFSALAASLSFDQLRLGQAIPLSAIYGVLQGVPGVVAVDVTDLNFKSQDPTFRQAHGADNRRPQPHLFILGARPGTTPGLTVLPAELAWVDIPSQDLVLTVTGTAGA